jgi:hypothetical protein
MKTYIQILALAWATLFFAVPAHADPITPDLVCKVKEAIRFRSPAWPHWYCLRVADAVDYAEKATGQRADVITGIMVAESDLRAGVAHWYSSDGPAPGVCGDLGIMGVRCCLGPDMRCSNGLVKGWKYPAVMRLENNILLGAKILAAKPRLNDYNGGPGYSEKVYAIAGALSGIRVRSSVRRIRTLINQILVGLGFERTS